ncbi:sigma 54-interacting transcriptional regulator [candidate division KSB1 bacterium]|nr:sigma 54-interacting transcriptional regulator [candidate division KSB1 bacterium]
MHKLTRILFVDGRDRKHPQLVRSFRNQFDDVVEAADCDDALQQMRRRRFDILFFGEWPDSTHALALLRAARERSTALSYFAYDRERGTESVVNAVPIDGDDVIVRSVEGETPEQWVQLSLDHVREVKARHDGLRYLRNVFCTSDEALIFVAGDGRIVDMNHAAAEMLGIKLSACAGLKFTDVAGKTEPTFEGMLRHCRESATQVVLESIHLRGAGGAPVIAAARLRALRTSTGDCEGLMMWIRPVQRGFKDVAHGDAVLADELAGTSAAMRDVLADVKRAAQGATAVLISGEAGTGKRFAAREIHLSSHRSTGPFVVVHCGSVPEPLLEGVLFGDHSEHEGPGRLVAAVGGTLLIADIPQLPPRLQERLCRMLVSGYADGRLGTRVPLDVQVIATSRRPLIESVARGEFSEELYERLRKMEINLPPLRERREDIPFLAERLRPRLNSRLSLGVQRIDEEAMQMLSGFSWPGNVWQLEQVLEKAFAACGACVVQSQHLPIEIREGSGCAASARRARDDAQREELIDILNWAGWNKSKAARKLGISRETLYRRMEKFELEDRAEA